MRVAAHFAMYAAAMCRATAVGLFLLAGRSRSMGLSRRLRPDNGRLSGLVQRARCGSTQRYGVISRVLASLILCTSEMAIVMQVKTRRQEVRPASVWAQVHYQPTI